MNILFTKSLKNKNLWVENQGQLNTKEVNTKYIKKEIYKEK